MEKSLKALKGAGYDLNAEINGRAPAFYMTEIMASHSISDEEHKGRGDKSNIPYIFRAAAENGVNFTSRNSDGQSVAQNLETYLATEGRKLAGKDPIITGINDAVAISKKYNVKAIAQKRFEEDSLKSPPKKTKSIQDSNQR